MDETTSSEQVLLEEILTQSATEPSECRFSKLGKNLWFEVDDEESKNVYIKLSEMCRSEAVRQSSLLLQIAEGLCQEDSPKSKRKGKVFKKLVPEVEKHVFNEMQQDVCKNMWKEARKKVYGTPCSGTYTAENTNATDRYFEASKGLI